MNIQTVVICHYCNTDPETGIRKRASGIWRGRLPFAIVPKMIFSPATEEPGVELSEVSWDAEERELHATGYVVLDWEDALFSQLVESLMEAIGDVEVFENDSHGEE